MKFIIRLTLIAVLLLFVLGMVAWLRRPLPPPIVGLWAEPGPVGEKIRFGADGMFSLMEDQPLIGSAIPVAREQEFMQGRYTFLDSTHIRTEFKHKLGSARVFALSPSGDLLWTNPVTGQLSWYQKRRLPL
jgi:hypothetical protein